MARGILFSICTLIFIYFSKYETIVSEMACALDIQNGLASRGGLGDDTQKACFQSGVI